MDKKYANEMSEEQRVSMKKFMTEMDKEELKHEMEKIEGFLIDMENNFSFREAISEEGYEHLVALKNELFFLRVTDFKHHDEPEGFNWDEV